MMGSSDGCEGHRLMPPGVNILYKREAPLLGNGRKVSEDLSRERGKRKKKQRMGGRNKERKKKEKEEKNGASNFSFATVKPSSFLLTGHRNC